MLEFAPVISFAIIFKELISSVELKKFINVIDKIELANRMNKDLVYTFTLI
jgi:hypothetical protein